MFDSYKPRWLYEALPYMYAGSGVLSFNTLNHTLSSVSGLLLVFAGVVVWKLRHDYRHRETNKPSRQGLRRKPPASRQI